MEGRSTSENVEESRPFVGEVCWSIFFSYRQILGRILFNFNIMRETQKVRLWFEDKLIKNVLSNLLAEQDYSHFENLEVGRFLYVQNKIERRLLATMNEILSGRSSSSEMLEHAQLLVDLANQSEIAKRREVGA
ncbi:MAG: hypothetical protein P8Z76_05580 [Alphaproteobacteria bacterium]